MKKGNIVGLIKKQKKALLVSLLIIFSLAAGIVAQVRDTDHKANQNLKSSARVNPATLAMEFSIPLGGYPGRAGNATPLSLNYSSKVWTMKQGDYFRRDDGGWGTQQEPFLATTFSSVNAEYSERTHSGWTSSLQPLSFISQYEFFGGGGIEAENSLESEVNACTLQYDYWEYDSECPDGRHTMVYSCPQEEQYTNTQVEVVYCYNHGGPHQFPGAQPFPNGAPPSEIPTFMVKRARLVMPDGTTKEFRKDDKIYNCHTNYEQCNDWDGSYLSVDGSGVRLVVNEDQGNNVKKNVLYLPDGGRYVFNQGAQEFTDRNGNKTIYDTEEKKWADSMGREITAPLPEAPISGLEPEIGTKNYPLPAVEGETRSVTQKWQRIIPEGCVNGNEPICEETSLENPADELYHIGTDTCLSRDQSNPVSPSLFTADPDNPQQIITNTNPQRWYNITNKFRVCHGAIFNPVVLRELILSDGSKYQFKYNRYGEITKIIYPTGAFERFRYEQVASLGTVMEFPYAQANRGVVEHWISEDGINETQHWTYDLELQYVQGKNVNVSTTIAPDDTKIERVYLSNGSLFGFEDPLTGKQVEEKTYSARSNPNDEGSRTLLRRTLTDWTVKASRATENERATRDPRVSQSVSIIIENGQALATLSRTEYDENGSTDPEYFSHLNVKKSKGYHYKALTLTQAETADLATVVGLFSESDLASVSETDYQYDANYKERGIIGLPIRTKVLNPSNPDSNNPLAKTETIYDNTLPASSSNYNYSIYDYGIGTDLNCYTSQNPKICWQNPGSVLRGNPTTSRVWNKDSNTWIETHTQYDQFGNAVKAKDPINNEAETQFNSQYKYAYPVKTIAPAPGDGTYGTNETSTAETTYDFNTGLPIRVKDDFGQEIETEYDNMLRPKKVFSVAPLVAPVTETIYGAPVNGQFSADQRFVKIKKQIDSENWDEAISWFDELGRTVLTQAKDSQGDVFVETEYEPLTGRVKRTSNPYRAGDTKYWSKPRYDELGRVVESYAPAQDGQTGASLGITTFSISTVSGFVGTVVTSTDASGRKGRSITNALGQLLRVDEPTATGGTADADLGAIGSPNQPTYYTYDVYGKMVKVEQGGQHRYFKHDSLGRLIRVRQPEQEVNTNLNLTDSYNTTGQWTAGFAYDILGNVKRATDANGVNVITEYDKANRVTKRCYTKPNVSTSATECSQIAGGDASADTPSVEYFYDGKGLASQQSPNYGKGKLTKVTSSVSETRYTHFDNFGRLTQSEQRTPFGNQSVAEAAPRVSKYTYNLSGMLTEQEYPSTRVVKHEFETDGDLSRIYGKANTNAAERTYANGFAYTPDGRIERLRLGNGLWESAKFNTRLQVTELALGHSAGNGNLWKLAYEYGELNTDGTTVDSAKNTGNIAKQTLSFNGLAQPFVQTFKYDSLYRLKEARETAGTTTSAPQTWKQMFDYDRFGNRTTFQKFVGTSEITLDSITFPTINAQNNRLEANQGYSYDKNGNVIVDAEGRSFTFNGDNKQIEVRNSSNVLLGKYYYDGEGKRVKKKTFDQYGVEQEETVFIYDGMGKLVAEYSTKPPPQNPTTSFTATDQLGSPRVITNSLGEIISRRDFQPFGEEITPDSTYRKTADKYGSADSVRQRFTGYQKDEETGLDFAEARMYENRHGRFTAVDPLLASGKSANPQSFNRYVYVGNNPIIITDPLGLDWYFNQSENRYDWYDEKTKKFKYSEGDYEINWDNWKLVQGGSDAFKYEDFQANNGTFVALDRFSSNYASGLSESDALTRATNWSNATPQLRALVSNVVGGVGDAGTGLGLGVLNFGINTWNSATESPALTWLNGGQNPFYINPYEYANAKQYSYGSAVQIGIPLGLGFAGGTFGAGSPPSITSEFNLLRRAELARDAAIAQDGRKFATYIGGYKDGRVVVGRSSNPVGCAENDVIRQLGGGANFTDAFGLRRINNRLEKVLMPVCHRCQTNYGQGQFPSNIVAKPGGIWY